MTNRIDLLRPDIRANPYPTYARLRREHPVCQVDPGGLWAVARHADIQYVLKHPEIFSSGAFQAAFKPDWLPHNPLGDSIITMDPPVQTKLRALVKRGFTSRTINRLEPLIRTAAAELADRLRDLGEAEFVAEFGVPFPARIIAAILGVDGSRHRSFKRWSLAMATITAPPTEKSMSAARQTVAEMEDYLSDVVRERRRAPADDMVSDLIRAELDGKALTDAEIISFLFLLLPAGFETTTNLFSNVMLGFLTRPGDMAALRDRSDMIPAYVEEVLRHDPPLQGILRVATRDVDIAGTTIPEGATVFVLLSSGNRDEEQFPDPDRFIPGRKGTSDMTFGHGIHHCLGAALARMEARIGIEELIARFRGIELCGGPLTWLDALTVRGPVALPLRFLPL